LFREIGYEHSPYTHCPSDKHLWEQARCSCDPSRSFGEFARPSLFVPVTDVHSIIVLVYRLRWVFVYAEVGSDRGPRIVMSGGVVGK